MYLLLLLLFFTPVLGALSGTGCTDLTVKTNSTLRFTMNTDFPAEIRLYNISEPLTIDLVPSWDRLKIVNHTVNVTEETEASITLRGELAFLYKVAVHCTDSRGQGELVQELRVEVTRTSQEEVLNRIFGGVLAAFLAIAMLIMGCDLDMRLILGYLKKPVGPSIGLICQFVGMPLIAYTIGYLILSELPAARLGLLLLGSSPGGSASNFWTVLFKGDQNLSVTMTFCSTVASFGMTTFWIFVLGSTIFAKEDGFSIPYLQLFISLISLIVPLMAGMTFAVKKPELASRVGKFSRPFFFIVVLAASVIGIYLNRYFFSLVSWREVVSGLLLGGSGYTLGLILSMLAGLNRSQVIAVSIETAVQNPSIALMVIQTNLYSPYSDIGVVPVVAFLLTATGPPLLIGFISYKAVEFIRNRGSNEDATSEPSAIKTTASSAPNGTALQPVDNIGYTSDANQ